MNVPLLIVIGLVVVIELVVVMLVLRGMLVVPWKALATEHPPIEPEADALRRGFQSYRMGLVNLGSSLHTTVDDRALHLEPVKVLRLIGMQPASVPWERMTLVAAPMRGRFLTVRIGSLELTGPSWALARAEPEQRAGAAEDEGLGGAGSADA